MTDLYRFNVGQEDMGWSGPELRSMLVGQGWLVPVEAEVVATVTADIEYDNPDQGDQRYSIHVDDLPYPGEYQVVSVYNSEGYEEATDE